MAIRPAGEATWDDCFDVFLFETYMAWPLFKLPFLVEFFFGGKKSQLEVGWSLIPPSISADTRDPDTNSKRPWH